VYTKNVKKTDVCVLVDAMVSSSATDMEQAVDRSGWMTLRVLVMKQTSLSVDIMDGEVTTVVTLRTSQYRVMTLHIELEVSNFTDDVLCVVSSGHFVHNH